MMVLRSCAPQMKTRLYALCHDQKSSDEHMLAWAKQKPSWSCKRGAQFQHPSVLSGAVSPVSLLAGVLPMGVLAYHRSPGCLGSRINNPAWEAPPRSLWQS